MCPAGDWECGTSRQKCVLSEDLALFLAVPRYHSCCMELLLSSKWCISKFLSKGLFFYYLLNFQTFSNFGGKKRKHMRNCQQLSLAVLCVKWLTKEFYYLTDILPLPHSTKWENEEILLSDLFTYIFFRTSSYGNLSFFVMQYSLCLTEAGKTEESKMLSKKCYVSFSLISTPRTMLFSDVLQNLVLQPQPFG